MRQQRYWETLSRLPAAAALVQFRVPLLHPSRSLFQQLAINDFSAEQAPFNEIAHSSRYENGACDAGYTYAVCL